LRMFRFLCQNLGAAESSLIQADYREVAGHTKTKVCVLQGTGSHW
jgi:hypothetical protein